MLATLTTVDAVTLSVGTIAICLTVGYLGRLAYLAYDKGLKDKQARRADREACNDGGKHEWGQWEFFSLKTKTLTPSAWVEGVHTAVESITRAERRRCTKCNKMDERFLDD